ncbi:cell envelope integrity TolA C-terminal domain-containing protein [Pantoea sp. EA-12]|uniref:cell envelope integrity TolA C-terminal domain-containing protein n=1 Tax=Pantoea sp. EA-12 TaxID=3043303 RepID=UPI0024B54C4A|nr:cell envelope integrity TolA C-terminal domain-containing protein [Pantoea sp. EA-12]MDI9222699.1 cell envelope integrity TolA C-terminal domain-containing protein [Pantoea sp. EA-12]
MRLILITLFLLAGCTPIKHPRTHGTPPPLPAVTDLKSYYEGIFYAIQWEFYDPDHFIGKRCEMRLDLDDKGQLTGIHNMTGDLGLCEAAMYAAQHAALPAPPSVEVYEKMKTVVLVFAPE